MSAQEIGRTPDAFPEQRSEPNGDGANGAPHGINGAHLNSNSPKGELNFGADFPIAICGIALRLPGGLENPQQLWEFLLAKGDAKGRVPPSRYNISAFYSKSGRPGTIGTEYGYFLDESIQLSTLDTSRFALTLDELEASAPQTRRMLEVARECFDDAGEIDFKGGRIGCYMGCFGEDWLEMGNKDPQQHGANRVDGYSDYTLSNRVSYEMDLRGPSMTIRTACSSALVALHECCLAIQRGDCESAIVGGANLIHAPGMTTWMTEKGMLSPDGSCKTFSADADGYGRGEAITAIFVKPLQTAIRDGNPIRAIIRSTMTNSDGKTAGITNPSTESQEAMIRKAYQVAGITDFSKTAFVECHGTGTSSGDPAEANAVARVFGDAGVFIGSVKPNLGHSEGASGLTSLIKAVLTLENRTIPPNIKFLSPNPKIPFKERRLTVPLEPIPWPESQYERVSVNSFGLGGTNAHVILDSARSFNVPNPSSASQHATSPQLLLFSANSATSLQKMTGSFEHWISNRSDDLEHLAYTLANRREHFLHRAFMVASRDRGGVTSQGKAAASTSRNLVMVFTGQGAQWPCMGRELLFRSDMCFQSTIRSLDKYLQELPDRPQWTLEKELLKPGKLSGVQRAELSQPLCTAVQIGLVDLFAAIGVQPVATVGHSSGEIAGAYASGALTAREAIIVAYQRGRVAHKQTKPGAMAAIGLSWDEVSSFLGPNVVVACENSPKSVTLSGDTSEVQATVFRIKEAYPDVIARLLKVDKAYHSYHMREVGEEYCAVVNRDLSVGKQPSKPFFSSVYGTGNPEGGLLDAEYWQKNLESPVLFKSAVSGVVGHFDNVAFLEIGPHPALAGPVRQILAQGSNSVPYVPAMTRSEDCVESFLKAVGSLFELNIPVNFKALMPTGFVLPDLPRYPWDHETSYWRESRISHEWRYREYPTHPLLGDRQLESTSLEPSWRNMLHLDNARWLRDHKFDDNIIFPCVGYVAIAGEAIRQISGLQTNFTLRQVIISSALLLSEGVGTELVTNFRRHRLTDSLDSQWWDFTISSYNGVVWTKHFTGQVTSEAELAQTQGQVETLLPRKMEHRKYYDMMREAGFDYGPYFQRLADIRTGTVKHMATAKVAKLSSDKSADQEYYHLHPTVVEACMQSTLLAATDGRIGGKYYRKVPTKIDRLIMRRSASDVVTRIAASATFTPGSREVVGEVQYIDNGHIVLHIEGLRFTSVEEPENSEKDGHHNTARLTWGPHIDFLDAASLIKPTIPRQLYAPSLEELTQLCLVYSHRRIKDAQPLLHHFHKYQAVVGNQVKAISESGNSSMTSLDDTILLDKIGSLVDQLSDTPVESFGVALQKVTTNMEAMFSGRVEALEILLADKILNNVYAAMDACDRSQFFQHLAHSKPNLRILEIGAGTGASTANMLKHLALPTGQPLYSKYTYTDISSGFFVAAKEYFKNYRNIEYRTLDISEDPTKQGFDGEKYDLVIATNVIHATKSLGESLKNVHKLLSSNGRLLLHELHTVSKHTDFIFGTLPGWWYGEQDGRANKPYVEPARWESELIAAGFGGLDAVVLDAEVPYQLNAMMVAKPLSTPVNKKAIALLREDGESHADALSQQLQSRGYIVSQYGLGEKLPKSQDVISLLDYSRPFFEDIDEIRYQAFQHLVDNLGESGIMWITHPSQIQCQDPRYAQIIGTSRTIRAEMLVDFATCEVDDIDSSLDRIIDVFAKFQAREKDELLDPDFEYAIVKGTVNVGRIYPFSLKEEQSSETGPEEQITIDMPKPGLLTSMQWTPRGGRALKDDEIEVQVYAAGLNFKDVLCAMAIVPFSEDGLGLEASGVVCRVGLQAKQFSVGDRVMLFHDGSFSTHVTVPEALCKKIPDNLTFEEAATMPLVYATAVYALFNIGGLQKGQSILIHSACGGVGLAAMQIARIVEAEIYATVGSEEKVKHLMGTFGLPRNRIFNSRDTSFAEGLMRETNGEGVDLVLNSLSGELLHTTWHCVAEFGKMVEIGKRDFLGAGKLDMDVFLGGRSYTAIDLDQLQRQRPFVVKELLQKVMGYLEMGHITPIRPITIFDASSIHDAFRHMQQGQHIGKIIISMRDTDSNFKIETASVKAVRKLELNSSASYLLVGGLGGIGRAISRYLVEHNARRLVFLSRSAGMGPEDQEFVRELESMGCEVRLIKGSVTKREDVSRAIQQAPNLKGIMQCTLVLRDQSFPRMTLDEWNAAVTPKVRGTWNLHNATVEADIHLDFLVLFSSMSALFGNAGQANYAGANTFLDAFVQYRTNLGLACASIDIGAVQDVGYLAQDDAAALLTKLKLATGHGITEPELLEAVTAAMASPPTRKTNFDNIDEHFADINTVILGLGMTVVLSDPNSRTFGRKDRRMAVYHNTTKAVVDNSGSNGDNLKSFLGRAKNDTSMLTSADTIALLSWEIGKKLFDFLLKSDEDLSTTIPLLQLGMDSLVGVEMRRWWRQAFGFDISMLELLSMNNLDELGRRAAEGLLKAWNESF
ncbi:hypothetical protein OIDMADRAFT_62276 [Oidiodendron maius Zn]|uniref:Uncharacterized protein n=1 Tax=Oidiodendron maius (strain Zn) TaxID=913774 RepID=A0A0C3GQF9_OIDMZ|nr:hypothetical protein OIDMADRAFT_62276 [Oidiodendron maius Zn]